MSENKLLPCPFCGGKAKLHIENAGCYVRCKKCGAYGKIVSTSFYYSAADAAVASWNDSVWDDIVRMRTLNAEQKRRDLQMHVCPLQLDIVERLIDRYSNKGDIILDPFGGIGTVPKLAIAKGRYGVAIELNPDYFRDGVGYCKAEEEKIDAPTLFDFMEAQ